MGCQSIKLKGIAQECDTNLAGIKKVWLIQDGGVSVDEAVIEAAESSAGTHTIAASAFTLTDTAVTFISYSFAKQTGSLTSTLTKAEANGTRYYTNTITLQFNRMEGKKHLEIESLAAGQLQALVMDNNNKVWFVGYDSYVSADEAVAQSGQSYDDLNGYTTTMNQMSAYLPFEVDIKGANAEAWAKLISDPAEE